MNIYSSSVEILADSLDPSEQPINSASKLFDTRTIAFPKPREVCQSLSGGIQIVTHAHKWPGCDGVNLLHSRNRKPN